MVIFLYGMLLLEDGTILKGKGFGAEKEVIGELVFNTSMTGYVEILTDPSYKGQIVTMTYPLEGNYGVEKRWFESDGIKVEGFVVRDMTSDELNNFLKENNIPGICEVDTRFLTIKIRSKGVVKALLKTSSEPINDSEIEDYLKKVKMHPDLSEIELVKDVSTSDIIIHNSKNEKCKCVLIDCGVKNSIIKCLLDRNCSVIQVPYDTDAEEILKYRPDFVLVSNGPGDPYNLMDSTVKIVKKLINKVPITGICLGHQIITLACGGETYKMKFGHRGGNQPVKDLLNDKVYITAQNHGFAAKEPLPKCVNLAHINLNDNTVEGECNHNQSIFSVQYHPEGGPGPHDARYLFDEMIKLGLNNKREYSKGQ